MKSDRGWFTPARDSHLSCSVLVLASYLPEVSAPRCSVLISLGGAARHGVYTCSKVLQATGGSYFPLPQTFIASLYCSYLNLVSVKLAVREFSGLDEIIAGPSMENNSVWPKQRHQQAVLDRNFREDCAIEKIDPHEVSLASW